MPTLPAAGDTSWRDDWAQAVHDAATDVTEATDAATATTLMKRDAAGRAKVVDGSAASDVATKGQLDAASTADRARANHTGTQSADTVVDGTTNHVFTAADDTKLTGIATGATANSSDATLLARANHTGTQAAATISDSTTTGRAVLTATDAAAARTAIGAGTYTAASASDTAQGIVELATTAEVQTGTDTARAVTPAGLKAGRRQQVTARTTAHTAAGADVEKLITMTHASTAAVTLPSDANDANIAIGDWIEYLQLGAGQTTFTAGSGATLVTPTSATAACRGLNCRVVAQKISANTYALAGDLA